MKLKGKYKSVCVKLMWWWIKMFRTSPPLPPLPPPPRLVSSPSSPHLHHLIHTHMETILLFSPELQLLHSGSSSVSQAAVGHRWAGRAARPAGGRWWRERVWIWCKETNTQTHAHGHTPAASSSCGITAATDASADRSSLRKKVRHHVGGSGSDVDSAAARR